MDIRRAAVIFDDSARPETTGGYCLRALEELVEVVHLRPGDLDAFDPCGVDLFLAVNDGLDYPIPNALRPRAWWAIDTHLEFDRCLARARGCDLVFAAQRNGAERLRAAGANSAEWLPLACDPEIHRPHDVPLAYDVAFVGHDFPGPRGELSALIRRRRPASFFGQAYFDDLARVYSAARVAFNRSVKDDVNMRVFEAMACGPLLLTNDLAENGQAEFLRDGVHLATYRDAEELLDKLDFYLGRDALRTRIAAAGRAEVVARHTYRRRMERLLGDAARASARTSVAAAAAVSAPVADRARSYFEHERPELLALVPREARDVLEIGCGAGRLGAALKARQAVRVVGVELDREAARTAESRLDRVLVGDVETLEPDFPAAAFDAVVCGDILEHLVEPERLLRRVRGWLRPGGRLVASLPNVRHHQVVAGLLRGDWTYEPAGLLDRDHVRFFARRDIEDLVAAAGFALLGLRSIPGPGFDEWERAGRPGEVRAGRLQFGGLDPAEAEEFYVYQYLVEAEPAPDDRLAEPPAILSFPTAAVPATPASPRPALSHAAPARSPRPLRILYLGHFGRSWSTEAYVAVALARLGHDVVKLHESLMPSPEHVLAILGRGGFDALLFAKGRIAARTPAECLAPSGEAIAEVLRRSPVPGYTWYFDRAYRYPEEPSREAWMRRVAPLCRVAFVHDGALAATDWARWHVLRSGVCADTVQPTHVPEADRVDVGFLGQVYGGRRDELARIERRFPVRVVEGVHGADLGPTIRRHRIILGPRHPRLAHYWSDRVYVVLGHGGFFLAPEVEGMRDEGFEPGVHYAPLGDDPVADVRSWLDRPAERERIAAAGRSLVLGRFTFEHRAVELARVIAETLP